MKVTPYRFTVIKTKKGTPCYRVYMGKVDGATKYRQFEDISVAQTFVEKMNRNRELKRHGFEEQFGEMLDHKNEILFCLEKVKKMETTLTDCVKFFEKFGNCSKRTISIKDAIQLFRDEKLKAGKTKVYVNQSIHSYLSAFANHIGEISWSMRSRRSKLRIMFIRSVRMLARTKLNTLNQISTCLTF